jgi:4-amino-4-deoxy-L-arabinose transferase-like glycosyltransferase
LLGIYGSGRLLCPAQPERALVATALVAFLPRFIFLHASVTNDALITFLCTSGIWQLLRLWQSGVTWSGLLLLGMTCGLAILAKNAGALFLVYAGGVLGLLWLRDQKEANGRYPLWLGMYDATLVRLPLFAGEERQANDVYWIGEIEVRN